MSKSCDTTDKMAEFDRLLVGFLSLIFLAAVASDKVPVLIWNDKTTHSFPRLSSGQTVEREKFQKSFIDEIANKKHNLVLFLQDKLSQDDITKYADVFNKNSNGATFKNLKSLMEDQGSAQLPSVESAGEVLSNLKEKFLGKVHELEEPYSTNSVPLETGNNLMVVRLQETGIEESDYQKSLQKNDDIIGKISSELKSAGKPFTAIYTAVKNSNPPARSVNLGRHLLAAPLDTFINVSGCIFYNYVDMEFRVGNQTWNITNQEEPVADTDCNNGTAMMKLQYKITDPAKLTLDMEVKFKEMVPEGMWSVTNWTVNYDAGDEGKSDVPVSLKPGAVWAPLSFSYACHFMPAMTVDTTKNVTDADITLKVRGFQIQAFKIKGNHFGRDNNCIGFFSEGVWSMLISLLVLLLVLIPGIMMLSNIRVMDRFDDPKGKHVTINVLD